MQFNKLSTRLLYAPEGAPSGGSTPPPGSPPPGEAPAGSSPQATQEPKQEAGQQPGPVPYERFAEVNSKLRALEAQLQKQATEQEAKQKAALEEQGKFKELYEKAQAEAQVAKLSALRLEVAIVKGLPQEIASRLSGSTKEELEADADKLKALLKPVTPGSPPPPGSKGKGGELDIASMSPEEIRQNAARLLEQARAQ